MESPRLFFPIQRRGTQSSGYSGDEGNIGVAITIGIDDIYNAGYRILKSEHGESCQPTIMVHCPKTGPSHTVNGNTYAPFAYDTPRAMIRATTISHWHLASRTCMGYANSIGCAVSLRYRSCHTTPCTKGIIMRGVPEFGAGKVRLGEAATMEMVNNEKIIDGSGNEPEVPRETDEAFPHDNIGWSSEVGQRGVIAQDAGFRNQKLKKWYHRKHQIACWLYYFVTPRHSVSKVLVMIAPSS